MSLADASGHGISDDGMEFCFDCVAGLKKHRKSATYKRTDRVSNEFQDGRRARFSSLTGEGWHSFWRLKIRVYSILLRNDPGPG